MATFRKIGGAWKAEICRKGVRRSKTFNTKAEASFWAAEVEQEILNGNAGKIPDKKFADLLQRYADLVSPTKRGCDWELKRIRMICRDEIADVNLAYLKPEIFAAWRDRRLRAVTPGTVLREWNLLSHAINIAIKEWGWLKENPLKSIKRPSQPRARDRLISDDEIERLLFALGYDYERYPETFSARVGAALLFAIETAMRAGEIVGLTWDRIDIDLRTALLIETKNGQKREVPLSTEAIRILNQVKTDSESVFNLQSSQVDSLFRKAKKMAMIDDLHFHDTRHVAITRLASKLDVLELARMVGHKDLRQLMVYYNKSAADLAKKLD